MSKIIEVKNLKKYFPVMGGIIPKKISDIKAVENVNFTIRKGETFGLVGESGCGKSTLGRLIMRLLEPMEGEVYFEGENIIHFDKHKMKKFRKQTQIIFQDPYSSLNPRMKIEKIIGDALDFHRSLKGEEQRETATRLIESVGLRSYQIGRYPHQFSGGERQRISIARALAVGPKLIVADEPVSALDVSIQAQILNLFLRLREEYGLTYLFISHDLSVVRHVSHTIAVMYLGKILELADKDRLFEEPLHPYTQALLSAIPIPDPTDTGRGRILLQGDVPSALKPPTGCRFHTRCSKRKDLCTKDEPPLKDTGNGHFLACHEYS